jgi:hypothetical protein
MDGTTPEVKKLAYDEVIIVQPTICTPFQRMRFHDNVAFSLPLTDLFISLTPAPMISIISTFKSLGSLLGIVLCLLPK